MTVPVTIVVGDRNQVKHEAALRQVFAHFLPHADFDALNGVGHLSALEAPDAIADACRTFLDQLGTGGCRSAQRAESPHGE